MCTLKRTYPCQLRMAGIDGAAQTQGLQSLREANSMLNRVRASWPKVGMPNLGLPFGHQRPQQLRGTSNRVRSQPVSPGYCDPANHANNHKPRPMRKTPRQTHHRYISTGMRARWLSTCGRNVGISLHNPKSFCSTIIGRLFA